MTKVRDYTKGKKSNKLDIKIPPQLTRYLKKRDGAILKAYDHSDLLRTGLIKIN